MYTLLKRTFHISIDHTNYIHKLSNEYQSNRQVSLVSAINSAALSVSLSYNSWLKRYSINQKFIYPKQNAPYRYNAILAVANDKIVIPSITYQGFMRI